VAFLDILCGPGSHEPLSLDGEWVVGLAGHRWPVVERIPILLPGGIDALPGRDEILTASRARSTSYYRDNYGGRGNPERQARKCAVMDLLQPMVRRGATILEAGAGPATLAGEIRALTDGYVALDLSLENLLAGRGRVGDFNAVVGDLTALPVRASAVDGVVAVGCLEYVAELPRAIGELCRVVRPGGFVVASFANRRSPRRIWDERIVLPAARLRRAAVHGRDAIYGRHLHTAGDIIELFRHSGAEVSGVHYLNPGLIGFPLSELGFLRIGQTVAARHSAAVSRIASEFLLVACKR
jgi:SAM-dependent methyltransferase